MLNWQTLLLLNSLSQLNNSFIHRVCEEVHIGWF